MSNFDIFIVAKLFQRQVLRHLFSTLDGVLTSATIGGTTKNALMGFKGLLITISSSTGAPDESGGKVLHTCSTRAPARIDLVYGAGVYVEDMVAGWIQLGGGGATL